MCATRWGIISAGLISHDFTNALTTLDPKEHKVVAVAARSKKSAEEFAKKFDIPKAHGGYEAIAADPEVDVVYIGAINNAHIKLVCQMLDAGKHVLCEKPLGMNVKETEAMIACAKKNKRFLMEAIWSRFMPAYTRLQEEIKMGTVGDIWAARVTMGIKTDSDRAGKKDCGGGNTIDMGIYCVNFARMVFPGEMPEKIVATGVLNDDGVDESMAATLVYKNGRMATMHSTTRVFLPDEAHVVGSDGVLTLEFPFWSANKLKTPKEEFECKLPEGKLQFNYWNSAQLRFEAQHVRECLEKGLLESPVVTHEESLVIAGLLQEIRRQIGVKYEQDEF